MDKIIEANKINFSYNRQNKVLTDVSFEIFKNDFVGLIGPNGGGKSTLLKIILGLLVPDSGMVKVLGKKSETARGNIGYVPQYSKIDLDYPISVTQVVMSGFLGNKKLGTKFSREEKNKAKQVLRELKLSKLACRTIGELSGGQRQRVMIARALVREPKLLLLDEPTNNVDEASGRDLYELLRELNKKMAIIVVSHDVDVISRHVNKIFCLNNKIICNNAIDLTDDSESGSMKKIYHLHKCTAH